MTPTFSVIVATSGRDTLGRTLATLADELGDGDEILCVRDDNARWGHKTRNRTMPRANGSHLWFMDDDDIPAPGALSVIRSYVQDAPDVIHIFRMKYADGTVIWGNPAPVVGNVGTPMFIVPNVPEKLGVWDEAVCEGDGHFLVETLHYHDSPPVFHSEVVALIRPE